MSRTFKIDVGDIGSTTGIMYPATDDKGRARATLVLGHGAGAGQTSQFMVSFAQGPADRGIDAVTFNFLYTEQRRGTPDRTDKLEACWRAVIEAVPRDEEIKANTLFIGGKSMGGRIASQVAAAGVENLAGLVFLGYPLHPPGKPEQLRSKHLAQIQKPMLFVQGSRDSFGTPDEIRSVIKELSLPAILYEVAGGDHSFKVPKSSSTPQDRIYQTVMDEIASWVRLKVAAK